MERYGAGSAGPAQYRALHYGKRSEKNIVKAVDLVSKQLGNTRNICIKYYIHPVVFESYEDGRLQGLTALYETQMQGSDGELAPEEQVV